MTALESSLDIIEQKMNKLIVARGKVSGVQPKLMDYPATPKHGRRSAGALRSGQQAGQGRCTTSPLGSIGALAQAEHKHSLRIEIAMKAPLGLCVSSLADRYSSHFIRSANRSPVRNHQFDCSRAHQ